MLQAIVFDFDGIIVDSEPLHYQAFLRTVEPFGIHFDYGRYLADYIGYDDRDAFQAIFEDHDLPLEAPRLAELIHAKGQAFEQTVGEGVETYPGVVELIDAAAAGGLALAIASGATRRDIQLILSGVAGGRLVERFPVIVSADDVRRSKPYPETYALAAERLGIAPRSCLAIEDTPTGLTSAKDAGLRTLGVTSTCPADDLTDAERVVHDLADLRPTQLHQWFD